MKKGIALLLLLAAAVLLAGCRFTLSADLLTGETYPDSDRYRSGAFSYRADEVTAVEVYWRSGEIEIMESDAAELTVSESGSLSETAALHSYLENGVLRIRFCASGERVRVRPADKHLSLAVPKGISLSVHSTSAPVKAAALNPESLLISAHSGETELGSVEAESVDLSSSSGSVRIASLSAQTARCSTSSGSVALENLRARELSVKTSSGSVRLAFAQAPQAQVHTSSGSVSIDLPPEGAAVSFDTSSGRLHTALAYLRKGDLTLFGEGEGSLAVETSSGSLTIR